MHLKYVFQGQNKAIYPIYVKSNREPSVQPSATLEHFIEGVKLQITQTKTQLVTQRTKSTKSVETKQKSKLQKGRQGNHTCCHG